MAALGKQSPVALAIEASMSHFAATFVSSAIQNFFSRRNKNSGTIRAVNLPLVRFLPERLYRA